MSKIDYNEIDWERYFYYDETSPSCLRWKVKLTCGRGRSLVNAGDASGYQTLNKNGTPKCWTIGLKGKLYKAHRIIWTLINGNIDTQLIDHIDGNPFNNLISNLRLTSVAVNRKNSAMNTRNTSGINGISRLKRNGFSYVRAEICYDGIRLTKTFSELKYPNAFEIAVKWREENLIQLKLNGIEFTERHGK